MKKWLLGIMALTCALTVGIHSDKVCAYAEAVEESEEDGNLVLDSCEGINLEDYEEANRRALELGENLGRMRASSIMGLSNVPNLKQTNSAWKSCIMQEKGLSIGSSGCCLTSFTIIQQYYGGTDTPDIVNEKMGDDACPFAYRVAEDEYGYDISVLLMEDVSYESTLNYVRAAVSEGNPVLIGMESSSGKPHFVVAFAYAYDYIIIRDPASRDYTYLGDYMDDGYTINRVIVYEN